MECCLFQLRLLEGLNVGEVFSCLKGAFALASWAASPCKIGFDSINMLFPATAFPFKLIDSESQNHPLWLWCTPCVYGSNGGCYRGCCSCHVFKSRQLSGCM